MVAVRSSETHQCAVELVPFPRPCYYVHNSKVIQHIGVENIVAEALAGLRDEKTANHHSGPQRPPQAREGTVRLLPPGLQAAEQSGGGI